MRPIFSNNLRDDIDVSFRARGFTTEARSFTPNAAGAGSPGGQLSSAAEAGRDACNFPGIVFWAGRPQPDFGSFLAAVRDCPTPPVIIANNDTTRYVADETTRTQFPSISYYYVSFAASSPLTSPKENDFYDNYYREFDFEHRDSGARPLDGHAALSYDATMTFVRAVQYLRDQRQSLPVLPGTVWRQIALVSGDRSFAGASGRIDFGGNINRHVPLDKPVIVLQVQGGKVVNEAWGYCGAPVSETDKRTQAWCPFDR